MLKNLKGETIWRQKNFAKSRTVPKKLKGDPIVSPGFVSYVKKGVNERGPFALT